MKNDESSILVRRRLAYNIRALRKDSGQSQASFARMVGINRSYVNQIEQGKENISIDIVVKIADGLDVPIALLFRGLENHSPRHLASTIDYAYLDLEDENN